MAFSLMVSFRRTGMKNADRARLGVGSGTIMDVDTPQPVTIKVPNGG
jgi:hypothetical protein